MEGAASENAEDLPAPPIGVPLPSGWSGRCVVIEKDVIRWRYQVGLYGADGSFDLVFWDMSGPAGEDVRVGQGFAVTTSDSPDGESLCRPLAAPGGAGLCAFEACPEECWLCEEHKKVYNSNCCLPKEPPHEQHLCGECLRICGQALVSPTAGSGVQGGTDQPRGWKRRVHPRREAPSSF